MTILAPAMSGIHSSMTGTRNNVSGSTRTRVGGSDPEFVGHGAGQVHHRLVPRRRRQSASPVVGAPCTARSRHRRSRPSPSGGGRQRLRSGSGPDGACVRTDGRHARRRRRRGRAPGHRARSSSGHRRDGTRTATAPASATMDFSLLGARLGVEEQVAGAGVQHAEEADHQLDRRFGRRGHHVARSRPGSPQSAGHPAAPGVQLARS